MVSEEGQDSPEVGLIWGGSHEFRGVEIGCRELEGTRETVRMEAMEQRETGAGRWSSWETPRTSKGPEREAGGKPA